MGSVSGTGQGYVPSGEADSSIGNALSWSEASKRERRKGKGKAAKSVSNDEDDEDGDEDEDDEAPGGSRVDKRRNQNKLAQRAFRARTKVQNAEVSSSSGRAEDG